MRIRTVKPELFKHDSLYDLEAETGLPIRLAWIGLFCLCDREGRFAWKPRPMKADVLPYDSDVDFSEILDAMVRSGFILRYEVDGEVYGCIPNWRKHQVINNREAPSKIPPPPDTQLEMSLDSRVDHASGTRGARVGHAPLTYLRGKEGERKGREEEGKGKGKEEGRGAEFSAHPELSSDPTLVEVLSAISPSVQQAWVNRYEIEWLKTSLSNAIQHHLQKENASESAQIRDWGKRLVKWLRYEKKPHLRSAGKFEDDFLSQFEDEISRNGGKA